MNRIQRTIGYAAVSAVALASSSAAWADCSLPNFGGTYQAYITTYTTVPSAGLGWASCKVTFTDAGVQSGASTCTTSVTGLTANLTAAKLKLVSAPLCTFSATFTVTTSPVAVSGTYTASSITLADDHLTATGVGAVTQNGKTTAFVAQMLRIN